MSFYFKSEIRLLEILIELIIYAPNMISGIMRFKNKYITFTKTG